MEMHAAQFITPMFRVTNGFFSIDDRNKVFIRIETGDKEIFDTLIHAKTLYCVSDNQYYCFSQLFFVKDEMKGNIDGAISYIIERESYLFGKGNKQFDINSLRIKSISTSFNYLKDWFKGTAYMIFPYHEHIESLQKNFTGKVRIDEYFIDNKTKLSFCAYGTNLMGFQEKIDCIFECESAIYDDYTVVINKFGQFLSLMCNKAVEVNAPMVCATDEGAFTLYRYLWVQDEKVYPHLIVSYTEIKESFREIIRNFYKHEKVYPVIQTLNSVFYISNSIVGGAKEKFLLLTKSIEALYSLNVLYDFSPDEIRHKTEIDEIIKTIPNKKNRAFLKNKLANAQRATFAMKFEQFLNQNKQYFLSEEKDIKLFSRIIKNTRNYYTHLITNEEEVIKDKYISSINLVFQSMMTYHLLWYYNNNQKCRARFSILKNSIDQLKEIIGNDIKNLCRN